MQLKRLFKLFLIIIIFLPVIAEGKGRLSFSAGAFTFKAQAERESSNLQNLGVYRLLYRHDLISQLSVGVGYSLLMTSLLGGDLSYGPDLGFFFRPFNSEQINIKRNNIIYQVSELWQPYVGLYFNQRQFQSVQSSYAGFGVALGTDYALNDIYHFNSELRVLNLVGPGSFTANEIDLLIGITIPY